MNIQKSAYGFYILLLHYEGLGTWPLKLNKPDITTGISTTDIESDVRFAVNHLNTAVPGKGFGHVDELLILEILMCNIYFSDYIICLLTQ